MRIVISEVMDDEAVTWLKERFDVLYEPALVGERSGLLAAMPGADALIVKSRTRVDAELLASAPQLRAVGRLGTGLDNIDLPACKKRNVAVYPASGVNARSVAEYVICTALMLLRPGAYTCTAQVAAGAWPQAQVRNGREMDRKTIGIVGLGAIGQLVARLASCMGMRVIAWAPTKAPDDKVFSDLGACSVSMEALLSESDIVSLSLPLTPETRGLMSRQRIDAMKKGAILINTARGGVVDNRALVDALKSGHLGGAAIDVYDIEPLPSGAVFSEAVPNLLLTPHIAGSTVESTERRGTIVARRVADHLLGTHA
ncbi:MAG TPA: hydroxyacid dehydrogenase [Burkholderiales bacterium]